MKRDLDKYIPATVVLIFTLIMLRGLLFNPSFLIVIFVLLALSFCVFKIRWAICLFILLAPFHFLFKELYPLLAVDLWQEIFLLLLVFAWIILILMRKLPLPPKSILSGLIVAYFLWGICEIFNSLNLLMGLAGFRVIFSFVPLYFIALSTIRDEDDVRKYVNTMLISGAIIAFIAIIQFVLLGSQIIKPGEFIDFTSKYSGPGKLIRLGIPFWRATSFLMGPNELGNYLIILLSFATALKYLWHEYRIKNNLKLVVILMVMFTALIFTMSRSSIISMAVAFTVILFFKKNAKMLITGAAIILLSIIIMPFVFRAMFMPLVNLSDPFFRYTLGQQVYFEELSAAPLGGYGFSLGLPAMKKLGLEERGLVAVGSTDIYFYESALQIGLIGLIIFILINYYFIRNAFIGAGTSGLSAGYKAIALAEVGIFIGFIVSSVHTSPWIYIPISSYFYILGAISTHIYQQARELRHARKYLSL
jgi:hypothetical protein